MTNPGDYELSGVGEDDSAHEPKPRRRGAVLIGAVALLATAGLVLSGCAPLFALIGGAAGMSSAQQSQQSQLAGSDFTAQQPSWVSCGSGMQCATVFAPLDWADPGGEQIQLALVKQPATGGEPIGTLFVNPGGPGASGVDYIADSIDYAVGEPLQQQYDVVGWDPRGVGQSSAVSCLDAAGLDDYFFGLGATEGLEIGSDEWIAAAVQENAEFGQACLDSTGPLLGHVDTGSTVQDLDMLRAIVGDVKLNYLGYSYGTYIGARYADAYPEKVGRLVLDGAIDPTSSEAEVVREQTRGFELALRAYVTDCLTRSDCPVSGSVDAALGQWRVLLERVDAEPLTASDGRKLTSGTMLTAIITPLYSQQNWPYLDQLFTNVSNGDPSIAMQLADFYYDRVDGVYTSNLMTAFMAVNCLDYPVSNPLDVDAMRAQAEELKEIAPTIGAFQGYGDVGCSQWPVTGVTDRSAVSATGADPILVVGTTGDPATPFRWAESLASQLESGVLLTYEGEGHTAYGENDCVDEIVESYLLEGAVPSAGTVCS